MLRLKFTTRLTATHFLRPLRPRDPPTPLSTQLTHHLVPGIFVKLNPQTGQFLWFHLSCSLKAGAPRKEANKKLTHCGGPNSTDTKPRPCSKCSLYGMPTDERRYVPRRTSCLFSTKEQAACHQTKTCLTCKLHEEEREAGTPSSVLDGAGDTRAEISTVL